MKTLLILTVLLGPGDTMTTTKWFDTPGECAQAEAKQQGMANYVSSACVELVKPYKAGVEAPHG